MKIDDAEEKMQFLLQKGINSLVGVSYYYHAMWMVWELHTDVTRWFLTKHKLDF